MARSEAKANRRPLGARALPESGARWALPRLPRAALFAALCAACLLAAGGYVGLTAWGLRARAGRAPVEAGTAAEVLRARHQQPVVLFRSMAAESSGRLAVAAAGSPAAADARRVTDLRCERVHFAAGRGVCLTTEPADPLHTAYRGLVFDDAFRVTATFRLSGLPSRVRVAPDGRRAAVTVFETGHDYRQDGSFSTRTTLVDTATGGQVADLEDFAIFNRGAPFKRDDFNFWGVTFARDGTRFYATLATGMTTYLVAGDVAAREAHIVRENAECPSLSPEGTRLVYKKRVEAPASGKGWEWRLHLLDLAALAETPLAEARDVDDQVDWLDDGRIVYGFAEARGLPEVAANLWVLPVDGSAAPRILVPGALYQGIVRPR